ncbi:MAG: cation diffusion facilitator family transporter [Candidatus Coproplasma sp.]
MKLTRERAGILSGVCGIVLNVVLSALKILVGVFTASISIMADGFNNLSDAISNVVTIIGSAVSGKPVDREHPFGHGRMEYISALIVAFLILMMGFELGKSSVERIITPGEINYQLIFVFVPIGSIIFKAGFAIFNHILFKKTGNLNLKAVRQDSINDCIATSGTIVALLVSSQTNLVWLDGAIGLCVSVFVLFSGIGILKDVLGPLIGQAPPKELVEQIKRYMLEEEYIIGVHDVIVHEYGARHVIASAHAEMPADVDVIKLHSAIDRVEKTIFSELNVDMCIHIDPVLINDADTDKYKELVQKVVSEYCTDYSFHDFRIIKKDEGVTLIFELVIPFDEKRSPQEITDGLLKMIKAENEGLNAIIKVEHDYA